MKLRPINTSQLLTAGKIISSATTIFNPVLGVAATGFFTLVDHNITSKNTVFLNDVYTRLEQLESTGVLELNQLVQRESFLSILLTSSQVAQRTADKEKLRILRNIILNGALQNPNEEQCSRLQSLVQTLNVGHVRILKFFYETEDDFTDCKTVNQLFDKFDAASNGYNLDVFAYYLEELKSKRLVRVSLNIEDEQGVLHKNQRVVAPDKEAAGKMVVLSSVALEFIEHIKDPASPT